MAIRILAIGDAANNIATIRKFVKETKIDQIHFRGARNKDLRHYLTNTYFFESQNVFKQLKQLSDLKKNYDLFLVASWDSARLAYLAGLNFVWLFTGTDIRHPFFVKNKELYNYTYFERFFYWKVFSEALIYVALIEDTLNDLKKHVKNGILLGTPVDSMLFNDNIKPLEKTKKKFTFFSPTRIGFQKGTDIVWNAIKKCKSDFEVLQCEWFDEKFPKSRKLLEIKPENVILISLIPHEKMAKYYHFADAILGQMGGWPGGIEREASFCKRPVICYTNVKFKIEINGEQKSAPFLPLSKNPEELSNIIDKIVTCKSFREKYANDCYDFIKKTCDPVLIAKMWDKLFMDYFIKSRQKKSKPKLKLRLILFLLSYLSNPKKVIIKLKSSNN